MFRWYLFVCTLNCPPWRSFWNHRQKQTLSKVFSLWISLISGNIKQRRTENTELRLIREFLYSIFYRDGDNNNILFLNVFIVAKFLEAMSKITSNCWKTLMSVRFRKNRLTTNCRNFGELNLQHVVICFKMPVLVLFFFQHWL